MIPFHSSLFSNTVSTPEMKEIWSEANLLSKWMDVERAITVAQSELGMVPMDAAAAITASLCPEQIPAERIRDEALRTGHLMVAFLRVFREVCGPAAEHFHVGPTTQDILDTALTLQIREASAALRRSQLSLEETLCRRAAEYRATPTMGRTHEQHALPYTFGFVLASWAGELRDHLQRAEEARARWCFGSLSGAVGTHNSFVELSSVDTARDLERRMCILLDLPAPSTDLHTRLDRFTEVVFHLAMLSATLGRIGLHLRTLERPEIAEIEQVYPEEACNSSTMPNKRNPEPVERVEGLSQLIAGHASAMLSIRMADHRDSTRIPVLYTAIPESFAMAHRAVETVRQAVETMRARPEKMLENLNHPESLGLVPAERLMLAIYRRTGEKHQAHTLLSLATNECRATRRPLREVLAGMDAVRGLFSAKELDDLLDLTTYLGTATAQADFIVKQLEDSRSEMNCRADLVPAG